MRSTNPFPRLFALVLVGYTLGCGGGGTGPSSGGTPSGGTPNNPAAPSGSTSNSVNVINNSFDPGATTVAAGTTVTWTWDTCTNDGYGGTTCADHTVTFDDGVGSARQSRGSYQRSFTAAGTYPYHCTVHSGMSGSVTVQ
jgi:plastocyanin